MTLPGILDDLLAMPPGPERVKTANKVLAELDRLAEDVRRVRNGDIRELGDQHGSAETARKTGMALSTVKSIRGTV